MNAKQPKISLIAAMAKDRVIGFQGKMPWHLPEELQYFKEVTLGKPIIMGRTTFESIGRPLPGRRNLVVSRTPEALPEGVEGVASPEAAMALVQDAEEVMVIGGGQIYQAFMDLAQSLYITHIDASFEGDAFFPKWDTALWEVELIKDVGATATSPAYKSVVYNKK